MFVMNECNQDNNEIADACVHKIYSYECYLYRHFTLAKIMLLLSTATWDYYVLASMATQCSFMMHPAISEGNDVFM